MLARTCERSLSLIDTIDTAKISKLYRCVRLGVHNESIFSSKFLPTLRKVRLHIKYTVECSTREFVCVYYCIVHARTVWNFHICWTHQCNVYTTVVSSLVRYENFHKMKNVQLSYVRLSKRSLNIAAKAYQLC